MLTETLSRLEEMPLTYKPKWWRGREALNKLFEGYVKDFGSNAENIIKTIIDVLGGCRLTIPAKFPNNPKNIDALLALYACFCDRFGEASGKEIMRKFIVELKGCRISFPDYDDFYREERDRKIRSMFNGSNYKELALMFDMSVSWIWRIVNEE